MRVQNSERLQNKIRCYKDAKLVLIGECILIRVLRICALAGGQSGLMGRSLSICLFLGSSPNARRQNPVAQDAWGNFLELQSNKRINESRLQDVGRSNLYLFSRRLTLTGVTTATIESHFHKKNLLFLHSGRPLTRPDGLTSSTEEQWQSLHHRGSYLTHTHTHWDTLTHTHTIALSHAHYSIMTCTHT